MNLKELEDHLEQTNKAVMDLLNKEEDDAKRAVLDAIDSQLQDALVAIGELLDAAPSLVMPVALTSVSEQYDLGWQDHAAEVCRLNKPLLPAADA